MAVIVKIQVELSGRGNGWTDISRDVHRPSGIEGSRGIRSSNALDRVATTGLLTFTLMNAAGANSGGLDGYYSPGHANRRAGFAAGIGVRALISVGTTVEGWIEQDWIDEDWIEVDQQATDIPVWTGTITRIEPQPGKHLARLVFVECRDYMDRLSRHRLSGLDVQQTVTESAAINAVLDEMPVQPLAREIHTGPDTFDYLFDLSRDESTFPLQEIDRIERSVLGLAYLRGDGTFVHEPRNLSRALPGNAVIAVGESDLLNREVSTVDDSTFDVVNRVQTIIAPRRVDASTVVLYRSNQPIAFEATAVGNAIQFRGLFTDSTQRAFRSGGINLIAPVATTDYTFNSASDGTGTDLTAQVGVTATFSGNSVLFAIDNNSGVTAYATKLQARGIGVLAQERITFDNTISDPSSPISVSAIGENVLALEMAYQSDPSVAREASNWLLHILSQEVKHLRRVPLYLDPDDEDRALLIARRDISDVFSFAETMTGFSGSERFFINAIDFAVLSDGTIWVLWTPAVADTTKFWHLGVVGFSELGQTSRLAFGFIVGHTDSAHSDSHSDTAHSDVAHVDSHTDTAHSDTAHTDAAHGDSHSDVAHADTSHNDSHSDTAHNDSAHSDVTHSDSHGDIAHFDIPHVDRVHSDTHNDVAHSDSHADTHGDSPTPHGDIHSDTAHSDSHSDLAHADHHSDTPHTDTHNDTAHSDAAHVDTAHADSHTDVSHSDSHGDSHTDQGHTDAGHSDVAHGDSHTDTSHSDAAHADSHGDVAQRDKN